MSETKELATVSPNQVYIPDEQAWKFMVSWGAQAIKSGLLPTSIRTPEAAAIIVLKGRELGISFMTAISHIYVINGKTTMSAELIQGLARRNLPGLIINIIESTDTVAKIEFIRPEKGSKPYIQTFAIADAEKAKLMSKDVWKQYPGAMLWSRAVTAGLRKICPEALMGISHTPEELGANVDAEGNVIETTGRTVDNDKTIYPGGSNIAPPAQDPSSTPPIKTLDQIKAEHLALEALKKIELHKIIKLMKETHLTEEDGKQLMMQEFDGATDVTKLGIDQLKHLVDVMEAEKAKVDRAFKDIPQPVGAPISPGDFGDNETQGHL